MLCASVSWACKESAPQSTAVTPTRRLREKEASLNVIFYHWTEETHDQELKSHRGGLRVTFNCNSCWFLWRRRRYCQALERAHGKRELSSGRIELWQDFAVSSKRKQFVSTHFWACVRAALMAAVATMKAQNKTGWWCRYVADRRSQCTCEPRCRSYCFRHRRDCAFDTSWLSGAQCWPVLYATR